MEYSSQSCWLVIIHMNSDLKKVFLLKESAQIIRVLLDEWWSSKHQWTGQCLITVFLGKKWVCLCKHTYIHNRTHGYSKSDWYEGCVAPNLQNTTMSRTLCCKGSSPPAVTACLCWGCSAQMNTDGALTWVVVGILFSLMRKMKVTPETCWSFTHS